jgi:hypothetical protein
VLAAILLSPVAEDHHYVLALLPLAVAASAVARRTTWRRGVDVVVIIIAAALLALPWPFNAPIEGWAALAYYPRVYGALLLWSLCVRISLADTATPVPEPAPARP